MWADQFVGLPYKLMGRDRNGLDCYGLVRLVLKERAGQDWPAYTDEDKDGKTITKIASDIKQVRSDEARELDVALIWMHQKENGHWIMRPTHMGIFLDKENVLHINAGHTSKVQKAKELNIHSILRVT